MDEDRAAKLAVAAIIGPVIIYLFNGAVVAKWAWFPDVYTGTPLLRTLVCLPVFYLALWAIGKHGSE